MDDLGATAPKPKAFINYKDTVALSAFSRLDPQQDESESSSFKELNETEQTALKRSFRAIQDAPDENDGQENMAFQDTWQPSKDIQIDIAAVSTPPKTRSWDEDIQVTQMAGHDKIQLIPSQTRESTPDSTGFSNTLTMGDQRGLGQSGINVNAANIQQGISSKSTREVLGQIRDQAAPGERPAEPKLPTLGSAASLDMISAEKEKNIFPCWPRLLLFMLLMAVVFGGIAAAVTVIKRHHSGQKESDSRHGFVVSTPTPVGTECHSLLLNLGDSIRIECKFKIQNEDRRQLKRTGQVVVESPNHLPSSAFTFDRTGEDTWSVTGPEVTCSTTGTYVLHFKTNETDTPEVLHSTKVTLSLNHSVIVSSIQQRKLDDQGDTEFEVSCSIAGDCNNYEVDFIGRRVSYSPTVTLNENKRCTTSFSDTAGYNIKCTATLEDEVVDLYRNILDCQMRSGGLTLSSRFHLPDCYLRSVCNFNCSADAKERKLMDTGIMCNIPKIRHCFPPDRQIWSTKVCPPKPADCDMYKRKYECVLGWCRSRTGVYYKNELIGGEYLCPDFEAKIPETTTTTTPATTTSSTTTTTTPIPTTP